LEVATGKLTGVLKLWHRNSEFLAFLKQVERTYRDVTGADGEQVEPHLAMDNYAAPHLRGRPADLSTPSSNF
jgi:hypothetical protein